MKTVRCMASREADFIYTSMYQQCKTYRAVVQTDLVIEYIDKIIPSSPYVPYGEHVG